MLSGRCIDIKGTTLPAKQCFCEFGSFGFHCEKRNLAMSTKNFSAVLYNKESMRGVDFYWRPVNGINEVEGVIVGTNTKSYVAVGERIVWTLK